MIKKPISNLLLMTLLILTLSILTSIGLLRGVVVNAATITGGSINTQLIGDLNGDNTVTNDDVIIMKNYLLGKAPSNLSNVFINGDMDSDGKITSKDYVLLLRTVKFPPTPDPIYEDPELARAVSLDIGSYSENVPVTYKQFFRMLDAVVALANPAVIPEWKNKFPDARVSNNTMLRQEGMLAIYFAAEALGPDYNVTNSDWGSLHNLIGESAWNDMSWNYPFFPGWNQPAELGAYTWDNHMIAAYFYSMGRNSVNSDALIFDYDSIKNSMRLADPFTYEEALLAALRLYDSGLKVTERVPTQEDTTIFNQVDARRDAILNSKTTVTVNGTSYYVSNSGDDNNDGRSPETAWATLDKVNNSSFKKDDGVFFKRGGLWRGHLNSKNYVTFSAYGDGDKPKIYASPEDGADPAKWKLLDGTKNIWVFYKNLPDCGSIVFNDGASCAEKTVPFWNGSEYVDYVNKIGNVMKADVTKLENLHYFSKVDLTGESLPVYMWEKTNLTGPLYLRCDAGNPGQVYNSIEFSIATPDLTIVAVGVGSTIDNLCIKYGANNGVGYGSSSIIQNCEVAWAGGITHRYDYQDGKPYIWGAGEGINTSNYGNSAINNYVHDCYDNGITVGEAGYLGKFSAEEDLHMGNLTIRDNLVEHCNGGLQLTIWPNYDGIHKYKNTVIDGNYVLYTGFGWSYDRHLALEGHDQELISSSMFMCYNTANEGTLIQNNVFYVARYTLVQLPTQAEFRPSFSGNTYVQNNLGCLVRWEGGTPSSYNLNLNAKKTVTEVLGDKTGVVLMPK